MVLTERGRRWIGLAAALACALCILWGVRGCGQTANEMATEGRAMTADRWIAFGLAVCCLLVLLLVFRTALWPAAEPFVPSMLSPTEAIQEQRSESVAPAQRSAPSPIAPLDPMMRLHGFRAALDALADSTAKEYAASNASGGVETEREAKSLSAEAERIVNRFLVRSVASRELRGLGEVATPFEDGGGASVWSSVTMKIGHWIPEIRQRIGADDMRLDDPELAALRERQAATSVRKERLSAGPITSDVADWRMVDDRIAALEKKHWSFPEGARSGADVLHMLAPALREGLWEFDLPSTLGYKLGRQGIRRDVAVPDETCAAIVEALRAEEIISFKRKIHDTIQPNPHRVYYLSEPLGRIVARDVARKRDGATPHS